MADQSTNVLDAAKTLSGLMQGQSEPAPAETEETTEEVVEEPTTDDIPVEDIEEVEVAEATDDAEQDIDESPEEPSYTVKVDGSELTVTLDELLRGYQREADYTRKLSIVTLILKNFMMTIQLKLHD